MKQLFPRVTLFPSNINKNLISKAVKTLAITALALSCSSLSAQPLSTGDLQINYAEPSWIVNVSSQVMEDREPKLSPDESVLGDSLRPLLNSGDYQGVATLLEEASNSGTILSPALQHILGQVYMAIQDNTRAEKAFLAATKSMPNFARAHQRLGLLYLQARDYDKARTHLSKTISLGVTDAETYGQLAFANLQDYSAWSAINGYQQALLMEPDNLQWQQGLLFGLISAKHFPAAQALIDEMLSNDENNRALWLQSSNIALNNDDPLSALTRLEIALQLGDTDTANQIVAAQLHLQHGSTNRAVELMLNSLRASSEHYSTIEEAVAWLIYNEQWRPAERLINAGLDNWKNLNSLQESKMFAHRGAIAFAQNKDKEALKHLTKATDLDPGNGEALLNLAELQGSRQKYVQASLLYTRAASLALFRERALIGHAQIALDQRDFQQAVTLLRQAFSANPARQDLNANIQALERIILNNS